jgi:hypothetical protein
LSFGIVRDVLERVDRAAQLRVVVGFAGHTIAYRTNTRGHLDWLRRYTEPQYRIDEEPGTVPAEVLSYEDPQFEQEIRRRLEALPRRAVALYQDYPADEVDLGDGWTALMHTSRPSIVVVSPARRRCVTLGAPGDPESKLEPVRCLREIFTKTLELDGRLVFHAGAVAIDGHGVAVCGAKGAGKSTTVISMVEAGASFLTNDRSYIGPAADGLWIHPWPTTSAIGMGTLYHFPGLRSWLERGGWAYEPQDCLTETASHEHLSSLTASELAALPDKLQLTSEELAGSLGSTVARAAPLECLVLPRIDIGHHGIAVEETPAEAVAELLLSQCFTPVDDGYPDWLRWRTAAEDRLAERARDLVDRLVDETPCVTLHFADLRGKPGRRALDAVRELVESRRAAVSVPS